MARFHTMWVTSLGGMFVEEAETARSKEAMAEMQSKQLYSAQAGLSPVVVLTVDGAVVVLVSVDHFVILTPEEVEELSPATDSTEGSS